MGDAPITQRAMGSPSRFGGRAVSIRAIQASQGRGPPGVNMEVGHSQIAGGSDQPVRGVMLTQAPHRYVRRLITPGWLWFFARWRERCLRVRCVWLKL